MKNGDMPAMPLDLEQAENLYGFIIGNYGEPAGLGLTKREYFAALIMQARSTIPGCFNSGMEANIAVKRADALLAELEKSNDQ